MRITSVIADISSKEHIDQKGKEQSIGPGSSTSGFISETNLLKEGEKLDKMIDKNDPPSGLPEHNIIPRKFEADMQAFEAKESQMSVTKVAQSDPTNIALHAGLFAMPDSQGNRHGHSHMQSFAANERHMVVPKNANVLEKDVILGENYHLKPTAS